MKRIKPRVLLLTNESKQGDATGQINGYELMIISDEIESCRAVSHKEGFDTVPAFERVLDAVNRKDYDIVVIWTPSFFPSSEDQFARIKQAINGRPILYWEGDPWQRMNKKKSITQQMSWWMSNSEIVFSVASAPHFEIFKELGANSIFQIPHTYCHLFFKNQERHPPLASEILTDITLIANNSAQIPGLTGLPGTLKRFELGSRLHFNRKMSHVIYGRGWPKGWSKGPLPYKMQAFEIRKSKMSINWDNFNNYHDYASDRLAISLIAGRVHITTRHPGMIWAPNADLGLFQEDSPKNIIGRAENLLDSDPTTVFKTGLAGYNWVKNRLSHREAARFILSSYFENIAKPPADPWSNLSRIDYQL